MLLLFSVTCTEFFWSLYKICIKKHKQLLCVVYRYATCMIWISLVIKSNKVPEFGKTNILIEWHLVIAPVWLWSIN